MLAICGKVGGADWKSDIIQSSGGSTVSRVEHLFEQAVIIGRICSLGYYQYRREGCKRMDVNTIP